MSELTVRQVNPADLKPYRKNAKYHSEKQIEAIANSIKEFGFKQPLVVDRKNVLVIGHGRWQAAMKLGLTEVPVVVADDLSDEQIKALRLADNKLNESEWDVGMLELELSDIELDMSLFGFDDEELTEEEKEKKQSKKLYEEMQLKQFEHHDYVVFVFENQMDWLNVLSAFEIGKVDAGYGKTRKIGIGRVIDGKRLLEKIGYQGGDFEQGTFEVDSDE